MGEEFLSPRGQDDVPHEKAAGKEFCAQWPPDPWPWPGFFSAIPGPFMASFLTTTPSKGARGPKPQAGVHSPTRARGHESIRAHTHEKQRQRQGQRRRETETEGDRDGGTETQRYREGDRGRDTERAGTLLRPGLALGEVGCTSPVGQLHFGAAEGLGLCSSL